MVATKERTDSVEVKFPARPVRARPAKDLREEINRRFAKSLELLGR